MKLVQLLECIHDLRCEKPLNVCPIICCSVFCNAFGIARSDIGGGCVVCFFECCLFGSSAFGAAVIKFSHDRCVEWERVNLVDSVRFQCIMKQRGESGMGLVEAVISVGGGCLIGGKTCVRILCDRQSDVCHGNACFGILLIGKWIVDLHIANANIFMSGLCDRNREAVTAKIDLRLIGINERGKLFLIDCNDVQLFEKCLIGTVYP